MTTMKDFELYLKALLDKRRKQGKKLSKRDIVAMQAKAEKINAKASE